MSKLYNNRQRQALQTKQRIYDVTKMLVDNYGIENLTIKRIAREANISVGNFYHYYSSIDELIYNMLIYINEKFLNETRNTLQGETYTEKIYDFIMRDMEHKIKYTKLYKDTLRKILQSKNGFYKFSDHLFSKECGSYAFLYDLLTSAKRSNEISADIDTEVLCNIFQTIIWGLTDIYSIDTNFDIIRYTRSITQTLLNLIHTGTWENACCESFFDRNTESVAPCP